MNSKQNKNIDSKNKGNISPKKVIKETVEINNNSDSEVKSTGNDIKKIEDIKNKLIMDYGLINDFFNEINNNGFLSFEKREEIIAKYSPIYKIILELKLEKGENPKITIVDKDFLGELTFTEI